MIRRNVLRTGWIEIDICSPNMNVWNVSNLCRSAERFSNNSIPLFSAELHAGIMV